MSRKTDLITDLYRQTVKTVTRSERDWMAFLRTAAWQYTKAQLAKPFPDEAELTEKSRRLDELNAELNMDQRENEIADGETPQEETEQDREREFLER